MSIFSSFSPGLAFLWLNPSGRQGWLPCSQTPSRSFACSAHRVQNSRSVLTAGKPPSGAQPFCKSTSLDMFGGVYERAASINIIFASRLSLKMDFLPPLSLFLLLLVRPLCSASSQLRSPATWWPSSRHSPLIRALPRLALPISQAFSLQNIYWSSFVRRTGRVNRGGSRISCYPCTLTTDRQLHSIHLSLPG